MVFGRFGFQEEIGDGFNCLKGERKCVSDEELLEKLKEPKKLINWGLFGPTAVKDT